jgi:hypothetical protein
MTGEHEAQTTDTPTSGLGAGMRVGIYLGAGSIGAAAGVVAAASEQLPPIVTIVAGSIAAACTFLVAGVAASNVKR